jgi:anaerobic dimethyl sulfoxide reductase subunit A
MERIPFTCTLDCGSRCELVAVVQDGRLLRVDTPPNREDSIQRPRLIPCVRGRAHRRLLAARERVGAPLRRAGPRGSGRFDAISWDDALDEIAARLRDLERDDGHQALLHIIGAGSGGGRGFSGAAASRRFFSYWGPVTETVGNMSNHSVGLAAQWMLGGVLPGSERATLRDARLILLWGNNPAETHMGPNTAHYIAQARDLGARVVLLDPRFTDSGVLADEWVPIRPGSDAALVAAMAWVMETEGWVDHAWLDAHTLGYARYRDYVLGRSDGQPKTPEWAEPVTGVPAETTRRLAREYATIKPACLLAGWGPQRAIYGEQAARAFTTLACMSGNVGLSGGGLASRGTRSGSMPPIGGLPLGPWGARRQISIVSWAADVLAGRLNPPCTLAYIVASNAVNRSPNTLANIAALERIGYVVVHEPYMTPTALHADLVLPINTDLERGDVVTSWGYDSHLFNSRQSVASSDAARSDYWVFARLAERLGWGDDYTQGRDEAGWIEHLLARSALDCEALRREGVLRWDDPSRVELAEFRQDPQAHPLPTPSGRIELANPQAELFGLPLVAEYLPAERPDGERYPLQLLTPHSEVRANSCLHANPWLHRVEPQVAWISRADAEARGILPDETVEVFNEIGVTRLPARVTERIMPGVVCIPQGAWYAPGADGVDEGGCANVLTPHELSPTGGMATHSAWVQVRRCAR